MDVVDDEQSARLQMRIEEVIFEFRKRKSVWAVNEDEIVGNVIGVYRQRQLRGSKHNFKGFHARRRAVHEIGDAGVTPFIAVVQTEHFVAARNARQEDGRFAASRLRRSKQRPGQ